MCKSWVNWSTCSLPRDAWESRLLGASRGGIWCFWLLCLASSYVFLRTCLVCTRLLCPEQCVGPPGGGLRAGPCWSLVFEHDHTRSQLLQRFIPASPHPSSSALTGGDDWLLTPAGVTCSLTLRLLSDKSQQWIILFLSLAVSSSVLDLFEQFTPRWVFVSVPL